MIAPEIPAFAFAASPLNRSAHLRSNPAKIEELQHLPSTHWVHVRGDGVRMAGNQLFTAAPASAQGAIFLGIAPDGTAWFATHAAEADAAELKGLRAVMLEGVLPPSELSILAQARSLVHWHETHGFCAKCGAPSEIADQGYRRHCNACGADHFPRTDPVVIMAICHEGRVLMGRQASWAEGMYSTLAGFIEPGEMIEDAVRREVKEEAGIDVGAVRYAACQPWPFPASLMIGMIGEALSTEIEVDKNELQDARWISAEDLRLMLERKHPDGLYASHPYAIAHHLIKTVVESE